MKILIIDDEKNICLSLRGILEDESYAVLTEHTAREGLATFESCEPEAVLLDVKLPDANGIDTLAILKKQNPETPIIMISGNSNISDAVKAIKLGAFDFLEKPLSLPKVKITVKKALEFVALSEQVRQIREQSEKEWEMIGESPVMLELKNIIKRIAPSTAKILIRGESGSGKELIARQIHTFSTRFNKAFVKFNSAAIPKELVESELFGFERGSFTGAVKGKKGKLEQADGGTLFLDEIGDMELSAQAKILRVIQEGEFERVGSNQTQRIDVRIIAATNKDLEVMVENGSFREDLYYRLNVVPVTAPPLRERSDDIPLILEHFSKLNSFELKARVKRFHPSALEYLKGHDFPGNVRELKNLIERIYLLCDSETIQAYDLENLMRPSSKKINHADSEFWNGTTPFVEKKQEFERRYLSTQLSLHRNNVSKTAEALGMQQSNLSRKLHDLGILSSKN
ncbi:MAG: sigma-54 dependent transcriptional regulator [Candidatus Cloacimonetes bacterium]|nr:sigma-54 dependent transcriptional regulator [Candidatus Cloacimonadota bacterium]